MFFLNNYIKIAVIYFTNMSQLVYNEEIESFDLHTIFLKDFFPFSVHKSQIGQIFIKNQNINIKKTHSRITLSKKNGFYLHF